ncbi:MAG: GNAT family N-acetyltransferase [Longicatena sp.]
MNIILRTWEVEDAQSLHELSMHPFYIKKKIWKYLYPDTFLHAISIIQFYQSANTQRFYYRAIVCNKKVVGCLQCERKEKESCVISYWLAVPYWDKKIMQKAVEIVCNEIFTIWDILAIYGIVDKKNIASQKVLIHNHFIKKENAENIVFIRYK